MKKQLAFIVATAILATACNSNFINISEPDQTVIVYQKFEIAFNLSKLYNNPYDFTEIEVSALFINPEGTEIEVPAFWYEGFEIDEQNQTVTSTGEEKWIVRFTPTKAGQWSYRLKAVDSDGTVTSKGRTFNVEQADSDVYGFIKIHPENKQYFYYENSGESFFGSGLNSDVNFINKSDAKDPNHINWGVKSGYHPQWSGSPTKGFTPDILYNGYRAQLNIVESLGKNGGKAFVSTPIAIIIPSKQRRMKHPMIRKLLLEKWGLK